MFKKRVIVIDDDDDVRESFSESLSIHNFEVVGTGTNGHEAVTLYEELKPEIIFLDYNMPNYDGMYALKNIRKVDSNVNIIIVTGSIEDDKNLLKNGACAVFTKPYSIKKMLQIIEKCLCTNMT